MGELGARTRQEPDADRRFGPFVLEELLGAGGMGEVYRARDTRLNRHVAIKVLPAPVSSHPERLARLTREAQVLASLNHPQVAAIYDVQQDGARFGLVLELVEGQTLEERLRTGPLRPVDALAIARQIAGALDAAHANGIIHRDLKPSNIKVSDAGAVKVLDFGIAKALHESYTDADGSAPTSSAVVLTQAGTVLGTPAYMSPEQARGGPLDKRTDIWSFGVVLYEMLAGRRPFEGSTATETLAAVLKEEPDLSRVPTVTRRLLRVCFEKDPQRRLRDIADAMLLVDELPPERPRAASPLRWFWPAAAALSLIALMAMLLARGDDDPRLKPDRVTFHLPSTPGTTQGTPVISPDGRHIAYYVVSRDKPELARLGVYSLETGQWREILEAVKLLGAPPFWSPDSASIGVLSGGKLRTVDLASGSVRTLTELKASGGGGAWSRDGVILTSIPGVGLGRIPATGGTAVPVTSLNEARKEIGHYLPAFLPDGRHFLYLRVSPTTDSSGIYVGSLDAKPGEQNTERLVATRAGPVFAPGPNGRAGHLLFMRATTLMAQPFDSARLKLTSEPVAVVEQVASSDVPSSRSAYVSVSASGALVYRLLDAAPATPVWVDRNGKELAPLVAEPLERPSNPRLSPDGRRLALIVAGNLWVYDLQGRPPVKLTTDGSNDLPLWTRDGQRLVYASNAAPTRLLSISADGTDDAPRRMSPDGHYHPHGWAADGSELIAVLNSYTDTLWDILAIPINGAQTPRPILQTPLVEGMTGAALSPDGRWLAYTSNATGTMEVWVRPHPGPGPPTRVSANGGTDPVWAKNGVELFYLEGDRMMAVSVAPGPTFNFRKPRILFKSGYLHPPGAPLSYDVAADGRFLMIKTALTRPEASPTTVVLNWNAGSSIR